MVLTISASGWQRALRQDDLFVLMEKGRASMEQCSESQDNDRYYDASVLTKEGRPVLEIEAFDSLALTMHHTPGACALLLGSGLSRAAGIPTGWEITLDLVRRVAALKGQETGNDPATWYRSVYGEAPNYSVLLDAIASTQAERRSILHSYIEPAGEDGGRRPTVAHRAIAQLVARGVVRVLVTTNFDRLLEQALIAEGVEPIVISGEDSLAGAVPLIHARCTVLKVHGDYLDTRIRNIDAELSSYTPGIDALLDQILDNFGLVVCGWSGEWDIALRAAILRAPGRRYPTYWSAYGEPAELAKDLIAHRSARVVPIDGADSFFVKLVGTMDALAAANRPHPQSTQILVAQAKRLSSDEAHAIAWSDLLFAETQDLRSRLDLSTYYAQQPSNEDGRAFVEECISISERLRRMFLVCGRWGSPRARTEAANALVGLASPKPSASGFAFWHSLRIIPAMLCFYWYCIGALASSDYSAVKRIFDIKLKKTPLRDSLLEALPPMNYDSVGEWKFLNREKSYKLPTSHYFAPILSAEIGDVARTHDEGDALFDALELLIALESAHLRLSQMKAGAISWFWVPMGKFVWRQDGSPGLSDFEGLNPGNQYLTAGLFGGTVDDANAAVAAVKDHIRKSNLH